MKLLLLGVQQRRDRTRRTDVAPSRYTSTSRTERNGTACILRKRPKATTDDARPHLAVVEVRVALPVEHHRVVAHHEEIAAHVVQRQEGARHDALPDQRQVHRRFDDLATTSAPHGNTQARTNNKLRETYYYTALQRDLPA